MIRKRLVLYLVSAMLGVMLLAGCATYGPTPGCLYDNVTAPTYRLEVPMDATSADKVGTASFTSILGLVATGDASVNTAMKNGGITKVHHVDSNYYNVLGIYGKYTVIVYGE